MPFQKKVAWTGKKVTMPLAADRLLRDTGISLLLCRYLAFETVIQSVFSFIRTLLIWNGGTTYLKSSSLTAKDLPAVREY